MFRDFEPKLKYMQVIEKKDKQNKQSANKIFPNF